MKSISLKIPLEESDRVRGMLLREGFKDRRVEHTLWSLTNGETHLNLYRTGSLLIQGKSAELYKSKILEEIATPDAPRCGCDESGKGDVFGGIAVCCSLVEPGNYKELLSLSPKDSKKLKDNEIVSKAHQLEGIARTKCLVLHPKAYNDMYRKVGNINHILTALYRKLIGRILKEYQPESIIIDRYTSKEPFSDFQQVQFIPKAESYPEVATASIIARKKFLIQLSNLGRDVGLELPKGSSEKALKLAKDIVEKDLELARRILKLNFVMGAGGLEPPTGRL